MAESTEMFGGAPEPKGLSGSVLAIAGVAVVLVVGVFALLALKPKKAAGVDAYAAQVAVTDVQVSQATNMAGGATTYVDGTVTNNGGSTVTGLRMEASFAKSDGSAAQVETDLAKALRTKDPIDLEPFANDPLEPGKSAEFRLIFEDVKEGWNQQAPAVRVVGVTVK